MRCKFEILRADLETVLIEDLNGPVSVTNDAEAVIKHLHKEGRLRKDTMVLYIDSQGNCDTLEHDGKGKFTGFDFGTPSKRSIIL